MGFEKGNKLGGRPRKTEQQIRFEQRCRDWSDLNAFNYLAKHADHKESKVFTWAITELLNRGFGKPVETVEANVTSDTGSSIEDLGREIADLLGGGAAQSGAVHPEGQVDPGK